VLSGPNVFLPPEPLAAANGMAWPQEWTSGVCLCVGKMNADRMTPDALQALMQHKDYQTTQRFINMARQLNPAVENLFVRKIPRQKVS
jgi:hypothetical protein